MLARITSSTSPRADHELVWVLLGVPHVTALGACNAHSIIAVDARTGRFLMDVDWG